MSHIASTISGTSATARHRLSPQVRRPPLLDFVPLRCSASAADTIECEGTSKPVLDYEFIHSIDKVTQEFIDFLSQPLEVRLFVSPDVVAPKDKVGTTNGVVVGVPQTGFWTQRRATS